MPWQLTIQAPEVSVVEARNENMQAGIAQCTAEMLAAQEFNTAKDHALPAVYDAVSVSRNGSWSVGQRSNPRSTRGSS